MKSFTLDDMQIFMEEHKRRMGQKYDETFFRLIKIYNKERLHDGLVGFLFRNEHVIQVSPTEIMYIFVNANHRWAYRILTLEKQPTE